MFTHSIEIDLEGVENELQITTLHNMLHYSGTYFERTFRQLYRFKRRNVLGLQKNVDCKVNWISLFSPGSCNIPYQAGPLLLFQGTRQIQNSALNLFRVNPDILQYFAPYLILDGLTSLFPRICRGDPNRWGRKSKAVGLAIRFQVDQTNCI